MTIASEITRLQWAKANARTSIQNKWVTVPSSAKLDTYHTYIDQIDTGGGVPWIIWTSIQRSAKKELSNNQEWWHMLWDALSYTIWNYVFVVACYSWYTRDNYDQAVISVFRWKKWDIDYSESNTRISNSWLEDHELAGIKLTVEWNIVKFETCIRRPQNDVYDQYWHHTQTYNMSNDTWGTWSVESRGNMTSNPYFSWYVNNQWLYNVSLEYTGTDATNLKFTPTFN